MSVEQQIGIEVIKFVFSIGLLCLTWFVGQRVLSDWDLRKKRREADILSTQRFQELIGEWKAVWRLWKVYKNSEEHKIEPPNTARWDLLARAAEAEGGVEAIITRLALERSLSEAEREYLGLFRQSFQQLREAIRGDMDLTWKRGDAEYRLLHELTVRVASIIDRASPKAPLSPTKADCQLKQVLRVTMEDWKSAVAKCNVAVDQEM
jgi:hypothetical protein